MSRALSIAAVFVGGLCICTTGFSVGGDEDFEEYTFGVRNLRGYRRLNLIGGKDLRPKWLRGEIEKPRGTKNMGTWTAWVYTKEQMERLGVDENGENSNPEEDEFDHLDGERRLFDGQRYSSLENYRRLTLLGRTDHRPIWLREDIEMPHGSKNMGTWTAWVYTEEQMERLGVGENGEKTDLGASGKFNTERQLRTNGWGMDLEDY